MTAADALTALMRVALERSLTAEEAERAFGEVMEGRGTPVRIAALLAVIQGRGATAGEVAGGVRALRGAMVPVPASAPHELVDTCGTGGGAVTTFNISTAAALVAAAAGVRVAKHGNRSFSSQCGSADVLEELGVRLDLSPAKQGAVLKEVGIVFMFAPRHHPAMRHVAPVRRELGGPTIMNVLGPLTNPAGARRQVVGVADPGLLSLVAESLRMLGHRRALVVHGAPGLDEVSPLGPTEVLELCGDRVNRWVVEPEAYIGSLDPGDSGLSGGTRSENAERIRDVLGGELRGAGRAAVVLNAGAAIYVKEENGSFADAVKQAEAAIDSGAASATLKRLRAATTEAATSE